jgi:acyl-CoA thioesterase
MLAGRIARGKPLVSHMRRKSTFLFDRTTEIESSVVEDGTTGTHKLTLSSDWSISQIPNGGYMAAVGISAARKGITFRDPLVVHGHYVRKGEPGMDATFTTRVLSENRTFATVAVDLHQDDKLRSSYLMTFGELGTDGGGVPSYSGPNKLVAPALPQPEDCLDADGPMRAMGDGGIFTIYDNLHVRVPDTDACAGLFRDPSKPQLGTEARVEGWMRFADGRPPCLRSNALLLDAMFPPIINLHASTWVPTIAMDFQFWSRPSQACKDQGGWVRARMQTQICENGILIEDGEIWDGVEDRLLGTSRQLAKFLPPRSSK